jgi:hypothetical protein
MPVGAHNWDVLVSSLQPPPFMMLSHVQDPFYDVDMLSRDQPWSED